jgi:ankyrin repeat protein
MIFNAINSNDFDKVQQLVKDNVDVNMLRDGYYPLTVSLETAIEKKSYSIFKLLFNQSLKYKNIMRELLEHSVLENDQILNYILDNGFDVNLTIETDDIFHKSGDTMLFLALKALEGKKLRRIVELLIKKGADISHKNTSGNTALHLACIDKQSSDNRIDLIKIFLEKGIDINSVNNEGETPLMIYLKNNVPDCETFSYLISRGADFKVKDKQDRNLLDIVLEHFRLKSSKLTVDPVENVKKIVSDLVEACLDINAVDKKGATPIFYLMLNEDCCVELIEFMIAKGSKCNSRMNDGDNLLHQACGRQKKNLLNVIKFLVENGAAVKDKNSHGATPVMILMLNKSCSTKAIDYLMSVGSDIHEKDIENDNVLHYICSHRDIAHYNDFYDVIKYLLKKKVDLNAQNKNGMTPLMVLLNNPKYEIIEDHLNFLLSKNVKTEIKSNEGLTINEYIQKAKKRYE